ncbi:aminotransferase class I/II-fold pyridoxal phosphate-dependent enzyme [Orbaceae bacterium ESL0727]|nr:aminotransferase class I/II-fold pyridoxal phosphate-dependent enzyme [Orbaceae bacterium ESL0727]
MYNSVNNDNRFSRRRFLSYTGLAIGGLSVSPLLSKAMAAEVQQSPTAFSLSDVSQIVSPTEATPVRLNFNENALGMSPQAKQAAIDAVPKANRYAKAEILLLGKAISDTYAVSPDWLLLTAGSSEGIRASLAAFSQENTQLVIPELTYGDGEHFARINQLKITKVPALKDWSFDIAAMRKAVDNYAGHSIVYLVNPNNPTSTITPANLMHDWISSKPKNTLFIVDEAYADYADDPAFASVDSLVKQGFDNVVLLKTFSKLHAMAGMRVGYILATPNNIKLLNNYVAGEKLNYCGVVAAMASLKDTAYQAYSKQVNKVSRDIMVQTLTKLGQVYLPSQTNFIFHQINIDLERYQNLLKQNHILVGRAFPPANNWCRITLGTPGEMRYVAKVLQDLRSQQLI